MILKIFNGRNELLQYFIIIVFSIFVFSAPITIADNSGFNPLYGLFISIIGTSVIASKITFILLVATLIVLSQYYLEYYGIIERRDKYFLFVAPLLIFSTKAAWVLGPSLISLVLMVIATSFIFHTTENDKSIAKLSSAAILFSIASLFYSAVVFNLVLLLISLGMFKQFNIRDVLAIIISFLFPYIYLFLYYFINDTFSYKIDLLISQFSNIVFDFSFNYSLFELLAKGLFIVISLFVVLYVIANLRNSLIQVRKYVFFIFWSLIISLLIILMSGSYAYLQLIIIVYLVSIFYSIFLSYKKFVWVFEAIILLLLSNSIYIAISLF